MNSSTCFAVVWVYDVRRNLLHFVHVILSFIYRYCGGFLIRLFQRLSLYDLMGFFFVIQFFIQLSLLPFGLPRRKFSLSFFGCKVGLYSGQ